MYKLTIAIPTYNRKEFVVEKVNQFDAFLRNHNHLDVELFVLDNCSTNYNFDSIRKQYQSYKDIRFHQNQANVGAGSNFLRAIELSNSEFVWLVGDDESLDLSQLPELLKLLKTASCYLLPRDKTYKTNSTYWGRISSIDGLLDNLYNLCSFFALSIYVFSREAALKHLKVGYENVAFQHPYSAIALSLLKEGAEVEVIDVGLLNTCSVYANPRFDMVTANIDVLATVRPFCTNNQFFKFLKRDFFPARFSSVFSFNIGIVSPFSSTLRILDYKRLMSLVPVYSSLFWLSLLWIQFVRLRRFNNIVAFLVFCASRIKATRYSQLSLIEIALQLRNNDNSNSQLRH